MKLGRRHLTYEECQPGDYVTVETIVHNDLAEPPWDFVGKLISCRNGEELVWVKEGTPGDTKGIGRSMPEFRFPLEEPEEKVGEWNPSDPEAWKTAD